VFVRAIACLSRWPSDWRRFLAPPLVLAVIGVVSIIFPELLGNGQDVAQLLFLHPLEPVALAVLVFVRPMATVASVASGAPGGLFTPSLAAGALAGAASGQLWLWVHPGGDIGLFALLGAGAMLAASSRGPISSLVLMMELTGQGARLRPADDHRDCHRHRDRAPDRVAFGLRSAADRRGSGRALAGARTKGRVSAGQPGTSTSGGPLKKDHEGPRSACAIRSPAIQRLLIERGLGWVLRPRSIVLRPLGQLTWARHDFTT
jgi:hypothetical protein